jgi:hypothetical protein
VIAGVVALDQRGRARAEATASAAQSLGAQALAEGELDRALLLAREGLALDDTVQTRSNLLAALLKSPAAIGVLPGDGDLVTSLALSPDGRTLAFADADGTLSRVDTGTLRPVLPPQTIPTGDAWVDLRFSDDGSRLAVSGAEPAILEDLRPAVAQAARRAQRPFARRARGRHTRQGWFDLASADARRPASRDDSRPRPDRDPRRGHAAAAAAAAHRRVGGGREP